MGRFFNVLTRDVDRRETFWLGVDEQGVINTLKEYAASVHTPLMG